MTFSKKTAKESKSIQGLNFKSWMNELEQDDLSPQEGEWILKGLQEHPEWVHQKNRSQETPLMIASSRGHLEVVKALIKAGSDLNLKDKEGVTALMWASDQGFIDLVKVLIEGGAHRNVQDKKGWTALMFASAQGYTEVVEALIQAGANLNLQEQYGWTALMYASHQGHLEVVQKLMRQGAVSDVLNQSLETAWDLAKKSGFDTVMSYLEAHTSEQALHQTITPMDQRWSEENGLSSCHKIRL